MSHLDVVLRLLVAAICGATVGLQVELRERPGGLRTHMLTTVGATAFCLTGASLANSQNESLRIIQGVASGVGFIGAASVLRDSGRVRGTATAASLWIAAAIGCQAGLGSVVIAIGLAVFTASLNAATVRLEHRWRKVPEPIPEPEPALPLAPQQPGD
jgi:putative Mg2+ transporter-C (MgtC) family protein